MQDGWIIKCCLCHTKRINANKALQLTAARRSVEMVFGRYTAQSRHLLTHMPRLHLPALQSERGLPGSGS